MQFERTEQTIDRGSIIEIAKNDNERVDYIMQLPTD